MSEKCVHAEIEEITRQRAKIKFVVFSLKIPFGAYQCASSKKRPSESHIYSISMHSYIYSSKYTRENFSRRGRRYNIWNFFSAFPRQTLKVVIEINENSKFDTYKNLLILTLQPFTAPLCHYRGLTVVYRVHFLGFSGVLAGTKAKIGVYRPKFFNEKSAFQVRSRTDFLVKKGPFLVKETRLKSDFWRFLAIFSNCL